MSKHLDHITFGCPYVKKLIYDTGEIVYIDCVGVRIKPLYLPDKQRKLIKTELIVLK